MKGFTTNLEKETLQNKINVMKKLLLPFLFILLFTSCNPPDSPVPVIATLTTTAASAITAATATSGGNITSDGGAAITARGVCWNTSTGPTIANSKTNDGTGSVFASSVTGLTAGTIYYIRAYATNSAGTAYGNEITITTSSVQVSDARFKYDIQKNVPGLDFINRLTPVTYYFDEQKLGEYTKTGVINNSLGKPTSFNGQKQLHTGFLAQDVEKIANQLGYSFDGVHAPANNKDYYSLSYSQFIMPLVKSVQEQQIQIDQLKKENVELKKVKNELDALKKLVEKLSNNK